VPKPYIWGQLSLGIREGFLLFMKIALTYNEAREAIARFVSGKVGFDIDSDGVSIWHDPNDSTLDNNSGFGFEVDCDYQKKEAE